MDGLPASIQKTPKKGDTKSVREDSRSFTVRIPVELRMYWFAYFSEDSDKSCLQVLLRVAGACIGFVSNVDYREDMTSVEHVWVYPLTTQRNSLFHIGSNAGS